MIASDADAWLESALEHVTAEPTSIRRYFPMVTRKIGEGHEQARIRMLRALPDRSEIPDLYRYGDVHERRAIVLSAHELGVDAMLLELARDAFRSNDPRLVTAAANSAVVPALDDDEVDQLLMKCVFMGIPLAEVPAVVERTRPRTSQMVAGFVLERVCAGREVTDDVWDVIDRFPPAGEISLIVEQVNSDDPEARRAAVAALARRS